MRVKTTPKTPFPKVVYQGVVTGDKDGEQVYIVSISGMRYFYKRGQEHRGVRLLNGNSTSVTLGFENQKKSFIRTK